MAGHGDERGLGPRHLGTRSGPRGGVWVLPLEGEDREPKPFLNTPFLEIRARFSPDGRWVAYESEESGRGEIYVGSFSGTGGKWQISTSGGTEPQWSRDGRGVD